MTMAKRPQLRVHASYLFVSLLIVTIGAVSCGTPGNKQTRSPSRLGFDEIWLPPNSLVKPGQIWSLNPKQLERLPPTNVPVVETTVQATVEFALTRDVASRFVFEGPAGKGTSFGLSVDLAKSASLSCELHNTSTKYLPLQQCLDCDHVLRYPPAYRDSLTIAASNNSTKLIASVLSASQLLFVYSGKKNAELEASVNKWSGMPLNWRARVHGSSEKYEAVAIDVHDGTPVPMLFSFAKQESLREIKLSERTVDVAIEPFTLKLDHYHNNQEYMHGWGGGKYIGLFGECKLLIKLVDGRPFLEASASEKWELMNTSRSPAPFISASGTLTKEIKVDASPTEIITDIRFAGTGKSTEMEVPYGELFGAPGNTMPITHNPPAKGFVTKWYARDLGERDFSVDIQRISVQIRLGSCK